MGSRSTYLRGRLGGLEGRALRREDRLRLFAAHPPRPWRVAPRAVPAYGGEPTIRIVLGPQADRFTRAGIGALLGGAYAMLPQSDRMGARLSGEIGRASCRERG